MRIFGFLAALGAIVIAGACQSPPEGNPGGSGGAAGAATTTTTTDTASTTTSTSTKPAAAYCNKGYPEACNPFGVDLEVPPLAGAAYWSVIRDTLKVPVYRPGTLYLDTGAACPRCNEAIEQGRVLVLVVRANGGPGTPTVMPEDLAMYKHQIGELLSAHTAAVAAVVIEESPDAATWGGTLDQYLELVAAGCEAAHEKGVPCADGGLSSTTMIFLLADHHAAAGSPASAIHIITAAGDNPEVRAAFAVWPPVTAQDLAAGLATQKARLDAARKLLPGVREAGVDLVNFHWYERDQDSLDNSMALARNLSGCNTLMTSDIGQRTQDGIEAFRKAQDAAELGMRLVVWSSRAESGSALLCDGTGALTEIGQVLAGLASTAICGD